MAFILVVDDQPQLLGSIQMTLELAGYRVYTAGTGIEALAVLQARTMTSAPRAIKNSVTGTTNEWTSSAGRGP